MPSRGGVQALPFLVSGACVVTLFACKAYVAFRPAPASLLAETTIGQIEPVFAFYDQMRTGVTVSDTGRVFVNFPRRGDKVDFTVGEIVGSKVVPYPSSSMNEFDPASPTTTLSDVQSVVVDGANRLWMLDTAVPSFGTPIIGGAKLVGVDRATNKVVRTIVFPPDVVLTNSYLNDVRFDLRQGAERLCTQPRMEFQLPHFRVPWHSSMGIGQSDYLRTCCRLNATSSGHTPTREWTSREANFFIRIGLDVEAESARLRTTHEDVSGGRRISSLRNDY